jgi:adenylate kinase family enzyme
MIVGGPGSGKSTLAMRLGRKTGLPVHHMDHIHWMSGWVPRPTEEKDRLTEEIHARDAWILEGGHSRTYDSRAARADTLIWLDIPVWPRYWRVTRRNLLGLGTNRPDLPDGCPERLNRETVEFYRFIWRSRKSARARVMRLVASKHAGLTVHHLRSLREIDAFLNAI